MTESAGEKLEEVIPVRRREAERRYEQLDSLSSTVKSPLKPWKCKMEMKTEKEPEFILLTLLIIFLKKNLSLFLLRMI